MMKYLKLIFAAIILSSCSDHHAGVPDHGEVGAAVAPSSIPGNTAGNAGPTSAVSGGPNQTGVSVATSNGIVARISNGLSGNVNFNNGNFAKAYGQVRTNLPKSANINKAAGFDQVQLLAFAACSDLTTGSNPLMKSKYGVDPNATVTANQAALVAAGMAMLDQHVAGLASQGPAASQLTTILTNLVQTEGGAGNSSTVVFMTICNAVNTAGAVMLSI